MVNFFQGVADVFHNLCAQVTILKPKSTLATLNDRLKFVGHEIECSISVTVKT